MKTLRKVALSVVFVDDIDIDKLMPDTVYIRKDKMYFSHLCLCKCKRLVNLPINTLTIDGSSKKGDPRGWDIEIKNQQISIKPSILNHPCECHYIVTNGTANIV